MHFRGFGTSAIAAIMVLAGCTGPTGPAGSAGPAGKDGTNGIDGTNGTNGKDGTNGGGTRYTLTATATTGGTISPSGAVRVDSGNLQMFVLKPDLFHQLDSVTVGTARLPITPMANGPTTLVTNVTSDQAVKAWFSRRPVHYGMKQITGGTFLMGADSLAQTAGSVNFIGDSVHSVTVSTFWMDTTEVTQAEYKSLMGVNPASFRDSANWASRPVENVTWFDAVLYCNARSKIEGKDTVYRFSYIDGSPGNGCRGLNDLVVDYAKNGYRLPTEAEWEYACRGGTMTNYLWGNDSSGADARAWTAENSNRTTHAVATKMANGFGLYDMTGNVWEWCNDWRAGYGAGALTDPKGPVTGPVTGSYRVLRGGSWNYNNVYLRSAYRFSNSPINRLNYAGFRVVRR